MSEVNKEALLSIEAVEHEEGKIRLNMHIGEDASLDVVLDTLARAASEIVTHVAKVTAEVSEGSVPLPATTVLALSSFLEHLDTHYRANISKAMNQEKEFTSIHDDMQKILEKMYLLTALKNGSNKGTVQ